MPNTQLQNPNDSKSLMDEYEDLFENQQEELTEEAKAIISELDLDEEFNQEIQNLIASMQEDSFDLSELQTKFLILIKASLSKLNKQKSVAINHKLNTNEKDILEQLDMLSRYLMMQKSHVAREASAGLNAPKDKYANLTSASINNTKQILKRFVIYEIYKVLNPHRIAGETKRDNFVNNYISGGIRKAMRYSPEEFKKSTPQNLRALGKGRKSFLKSGGMAR
jgi:hypothetical protein